MQRDPLMNPSKNGVFGAEIVLNTRTGHACFRSKEGSVIRAPPEPPTTNAFFVWVGRPVIVVSEGVSAEDADDVANALRGFVGEEHIPIVFNLGRSDVSDARVMASGSSCSLRELALAEAYALVQCAWLEAERLRVEVDGRLFDFRVEFLPEADGKYVPFIE
jgi:hypothetical protein